MPPMFSRKGDAGPAPEPDAAAGPSGRSPLEQLAENLRAVGRLFDDASHQVADYLLHRESQTPAALSSGAPLGPRTDNLAKSIATLEEKVDALAARIPNEDRQAAAGAAAPEAVDELFRPVRDKLEVLASRIPRSTRRSN